MADEEVDDTQESFQELVERTVAEIRSIDSSLSTTMLSILIQGLTNQVFRIEEYARERIDNVENGLLDLISNLNERNSLEVAGLSLMDERLSALEQAEEP